MGGEEFDSNQPNESPMADLANVKTFEEHIADIREESANSESDSVEEQKSEYQKVDREIFEGIRSIEDKTDRDLATAILSLYYSPTMGKEDGTRSDKDVVNMKTMGALVGYMHGDKTEPLNLRHKLFNVLQLGHEVENFETFGKEASSNGYTHFEVPGREYGANFYFRSERVDYGEKAITAILAKNIAERLNNPNNDGEREIDTAELDMLSKAYELGADSYYMDHPVERYVKYYERTSERQMHAEMSNAMRGYESGQTELGVKVKGEGGIANYLAAKRLASEFSWYSYAQKLYRSNLEIGRQILDGEDWREIERPNLVKMRRGELSE